MPKCAGKCMKFGMRCKYFCWTLHHDGEFALALPKPLSKGAGEVLVGTHQLWQGSVQGLFQCPLGMTSTSRTTCNPTSWVTSASGSGGLSTTRLDVTSLSTCLVRIISHFPLPLIFFIYDLVPKGVHENRTKGVENKVDDTLKLVVFLECAQC